MATTTNSWVGSAGAGGFDVRSDTMTTPTQSMLNAITTCTLRDDVFREDRTTMDLEEHIAKLSGKEAALFVLSGTMGNQVALRTLLTQAPHSVIADYRSHIVKYEAGGVSAHTGATVVALVPANGTHLTLEDIQKNVELSNDVHYCPTRVISLENTLNGMVMPQDEVRRIAAYAREHNILLHCDGARMWEAVAAKAGTLSELCAEFDTVSLCFSKGLGAPIGSIIVSSKARIEHCRHIRKMMGGGTRQPGALTAAARVAVDETFGLTDDGQSGLLPGTHAMAKKVEALWVARGGTLVHPVHTNMAWLDIEAAGVDSDKFIALCEEQGIAASGGRIITHYQVTANGEAVLQKLEKVFDAVLKK